MSKYGQPYDLHITLRQPCFIDEKDEDKLKSKVDALLREGKIKRMVTGFTRVVFEEPTTQNGGCIMLNASSSTSLSKLQKHLVLGLKEYAEYQYPERKTYEDNFMPHITIGDNLSLKLYKEAVAELPSKIDVKAEINSVVLIVVVDDSETERKNPNNITTYNLV